MRDADYEAMRRRAEERVKARQEFGIHFGIYLIVNFVLWGLWFFLGLWTHFWFPFPIIISFLWGIGISIHALVTYSKSSTSAVQREIAIEREIRKELELRGLSPETVLEKPKRAAMRLSDDGELVEVDDNLEENVRKRTNGKQK